MLNISTELKFVTTEMSALIFDLYVYIVYVCIFQTDDTTERRPFVRLTAKQKQKNQPQKENTMQKCLPDIFRHEQYLFIFVRIFYLN